MNYKVVVPIDGCEDETEFEITKLDDFFSVIRGVDTDVTLRLMSFGALKSLAFELPENFKAKLEIGSLEDISIFYVFVLQSHVSDSSMNIFTPIIMNNKSFKMGQINLDISELGLDSLNDILPNLRP
ncbi:MAG: flagellar assembly protein FliW [Arcobacter sp.]|nr:flagellar assembly protein FliW [Arcobacter sp.]